MVMSTSLDFIYWFIGTLVAYILIAWVLHQWRWSHIEKLNQTVGITRQNAYIGKGGYLRWKEGDKLCHRDIAYRTLNHRDGSFSAYDVHHRNGDKLDNRPANLQLLNREEHQRAHGEIIEDRGKRYVRLCWTRDIARQTAKAVLVENERVPENTWLPQSQIVRRGQYLYVQEWVMREKGLRKLNVNPTEEGSAASWWRFYENNKEEVVGGLVVAIVLIIILMIY
jgi:hypothetical protein